MERLKLIYPDNIIFEIESLSIDLKLRPFLAEDAFIQQNLSDKALARENILLIFSRLILPESAALLRKKVKVGFFYRIFKKVHTLQALNLIIPYHEKSLESVAHAVMLTQGYTAKDIADSVKSNDTQKKTA